MLVCEGVWIVLLLAENLDRFANLDIPESPERGIETIGTIEAVAIVVIEVIATI